MHVLFARVEPRALLPGVAINWPDWTSVNLVSLAIFLVAALLLFRFKFGIEKLLGLSALTGMLVFALRLA
ncbi:hypothetical protein D3C72_2327420 [compost metagenome]